MNRRKGLVMAVNPKIFRKYDIRGIAETDFTDDVVKLIALLS